MDNMYTDCTSIKSYLPMTYNKVNVKVVNYMFANSGVTDIMGTFWNFPNVSGNLCGVFNGCTRLTKYNFVSANMPNVTGIPSNFFTSNTYRAPIDMSNSRFDNLTSIAMVWSGTNDINMYNMYAPNLTLNHIIPASINLANATINSMQWNSMTYGIRQC